MIKVSGIIFFFFSFLIVNGACSVVQAGEPYTPLPGSIERQAIMDTLREGLKKFPDVHSLDFKYTREDIKIPPEIKIKFLVAHLQVKGKWAWIEARSVNYGGYLICALLHKDGGKWEVKGIVMPSYVFCPKGEIRLDVNAFVYEKVRQSFPSVPAEIFPYLHPERESVLKTIKTLPVFESIDAIFYVNRFKEKNGWVWIETDPRTLDKGGQFELINALLHKEKGEWKIIEVMPCCGEYEEHPGIKKYGSFINYLKHRYPHVPKEIFPKRGMW